MCFTTIMYNPKGIGNQGLSILQIAIKEYQVRNDDGYGLWYSNYAGVSGKIRTLNKDEFTAFIESKQDELKKAKMVHLHLRSSTNVVKQEYVHLWEFSGWNCSHNGVMSGRFEGGSELRTWDNKSQKWEVTIKDDKNDSLEFFKYLDSVMSSDNINKIAKKVNKTTGWGVFLMSSLTKPVMMAISFGKSLKIQKTMAGMVMLSSDEISFSLMDSFFGIDLSTDAYSGKIESKLIRINFENEKFEDAVLRENTSYYYTSPYRKWDDTVPLRINDKQKNLSLNNDALRGFDDYYYLE